MERFFFHVLDGTGSLDDGGRSYPEVMPREAVMVAKGEALKDLGAAALQSLSLSPK